MAVEISIKFCISPTASPGKEYNAQHLGKAVHFVTQTVEEVGRRLAHSSATFDGVTGEPIYTGGYVTPETAKLITDMTVLSASGLANFLVEQEAEESITIEPNIIEPYLGDLDDD